LYGSMNKFLLVPKTSLTSETERSILLEKEGPVIKKWDALESGILKN
jgi:hypothetical protein